MKSTVRRGITRGSTATVRIAATLQPSESRARMPLAPAWYMVARIFQSTEPGRTPPLTAEVIRSPSGSGRAIEIDSDVESEAACARVGKARAVKAKAEMTAVAK